MRSNGPLRHALAGFAIGIAALASLALGGCNTQSGISPPSGPYRVANVFDGDSFNLTAANNQTVRVRIAGIDAPEKSQPYSQKSRESLESLLNAGPIVLTPVKIDRFERWVAHVSVNRHDIGLAQIERGYAWFFVRYQNDLDEQRRADYARAESAARQAGIGLWAGIAASGKNPALAPEPPWKFRERIKKEK
jgi:endonuclease YncB( thermonuclease family)